MKIRVEPITKDPIQLCARSSYISHSNQRIIEVFDGKEPKDPLKYLKRIIKMGHLSVLEHAYFNVLVEDAPVTLEIFAINFRLASFTVKSRRYTDVIKEGFFDCEEPIKPVFLEKIKSFYQKSLESNIPLEDARFILPYCFKTNFIMSMNARELGYFLYAAIYEAKLKEIKIAAEEILHQLEDIFPIYNDYLEFFKKEPISLEDLSLEENYFKPTDKIQILNHTQNSEELYQSLLLFLKKGSLYHAHKIEPSVIHKSLFLSHNRALEAIVYSLYIPQISLAGLTHILRHRMQSPILPDIYSPDLKYNLLIPDTIKKTDLYGEFLEIGLLSKELEDKTKNIYYRLVAAAFPIITTMNLRELLHFFKLRLCQRAQWEIREIAEKMLFELQAYAPVFFTNLGPNCVLMGKCPEGSHSCGKIDEMLKKYGKNIIA